MKDNSVYGFYASTEEMEGVSDDNNNGNKPCCRRENLDYFRFKLRNSKTLINN